MAAKSNKDKKNPGKKTPAEKNNKPKPLSGAKKQLEDENDFDDAEDEIKLKASSLQNTKSSSTKTKYDTTEDDDELDTVDEVDEWEKPSEEENWDPDFDEFDIPKSRIKKSSGKKSDDDDFGIDEDFKEFDLFNDTYEDEDDDDF